MSHYIVLVFTDGDNTVEDLLAPYDENLSVPHYISREQLIADARESFERFRDGTYAKYRENPNKYIREHSRNKAHINYLTKEFPKKFAWTDEDFYQEAIADCEDQVQEDGSVYSEYNPNSKWDWYSYGGRWGNMLKLKPDSARAREDYEDPNDAQCDDAEVSDIDFDNMPDFTTYAVVTPDGEWHAPGTMGWFACSTETEDEYAAWKREYKSKFLDSAQPDWHAYLMDLHI